MCVSARERIQFPSVLLQPLGITPSLESTTGAQAKTDYRTRRRPFPASSRSRLNSASWGRLKTDVGRNSVRLLVITPEERSTSRPFESSSKCYCRLERSCESDDERRRHPEDGNDGFELFPSARARCVVHKRTDTPLGACHDRQTADCRDNHMLFIVGVGIVLVSVGIIPRMWVPGGVNSTNLGWMSEQ